MTQQSQLHALVLNILNDYKAQGIEEGVQVAAYHQGKRVVDIVSAPSPGSMRSAPTI